MQDLKRVMWYELRHFVKLFFIIITFYKSEHSDYKNVYFSHPYYVKKLANNAINVTCKRIRMLAILKTQFRSIS